MKKVVGYGCISTPKITNRNISEFDKTKTNVYRKTKTKLEELGFVESEVYVDVINSHKRERNILESLVKDLEPEDVILMLSLSSLGKGIELAENYSNLVVGHIGILIPDSDSKNGISKYSTVNLNLETLTSEMDFKTIINELTSSEQSTFKSFQGRSKKMLSDDFIYAYWQYERFLIPETRAYELAGMSKATFHKLADEYERTPEYLERLELENEENQIIKKPKRHGAVPENFVSVIAMAETGVPVDIACMQHNIVPINPIDFERYKIKYSGGRKALAKAMEY